MQPRTLILVALTVSLAIPPSLAAVFPFGSVTVETTLSAAQFQKLADAMMSVPEVQQVFLPGSTVAFVITDHGGGAYGGPVDAQFHVAVKDQRGNADGDHQISMSRDTALSIINAYARPNTAKLMLKDHLIGLSSTSLKARTAFGAIARTSADSRLTTHDPAAGDQVNTEECSGILATSSSDTSPFTARLCGSTYTINKYGALTGIAQPPAYKPPPSAPPMTPSPPAGTRGLSPGTPCTNVIGGTCTISGSVGGTWTKTG